MLLYLSRRQDINYVKPPALLMWCVHLLIIPDQNYQEEFMKTLRLYVFLSTNASPVYLQATIFVTNRVLIRNALRLLPRVLEARIRFPFCLTFNNSLSQFVLVFS